LTSIPIVITDLTHFELSGLVSFISVIKNKTNLLCPYTHHNQFSLAVTFRIGLITPHL